MIVEEEEMSSRGTRIIGLHIKDKVPKTLEDLLDWFFLNIHGIHALGCIEPSP